MQILLFPLQMKKNCMFTFMLILKTYIQKPLSLLKSERPVILYRSTKDYKEVSDIKVKATSNTRQLISNVSFTLLEQLTVLKKQIATSSYDLLMIWVFNDCAIQLTAMWKWVSSVWSSCQFLKNQYINTNQTKNQTAQNNSIYITSNLFTKHQHSKLNFNTVTFHSPSSLW